MKNFLAFLFVGWSSSFAFAQTSAPTRFETVLSYFDQGHLPAVTSTQAWSGRCYKFGANVATPSILAFKKVTIPVPNEGPLFPSDPEVQIHMGPIFMTGDQRPDRFDSLTPQDEWTLKMFMNSPQMTHLKSDVVDGSMQSTSRSANLIIQTRSYFADASTPYFVVKAVVLEDRPHFSAGETYAACYYFKKILE